MKRLSRYSLLFVLALCIGLGTSYIIETKADAKQKKSKSSKTALPILDPNDPNSIIYGGTDGQIKGKGDPDKPASESVRIGMGWHPQALSDQRLPKDRYGLIDWAELVRKKMILPKHSLDPNEEEMPPLDMNVVIEAKSDFVNDVVYPHWIHTYWLKCEVCHPKIFVPQKGGNPKMSMAGITQGEWCGRCHGKVAFPLTDCMRCHVKPKSAKK